jgi:hypothetical protein
VEEMPRSGSARRRNAVNSFTDTGSPRDAQDALDF